MTDEPNPLLSNISASEVASWHELLAKKGFPGISTILDSQHDALMQAKARIGVIGSTGAGKSSFINAIRSMTADDDKGAWVNDKGATTKPITHSHPTNRELEFCEIPTVEAMKLPKDSYLKEIDLDCYDRFVIVSRKRFTEVDAWIAGEIGNRGKKCYFARTKIGMEVLSDRQAHPLMHDEQQVLREIRDSLQGNLKELDLCKAPLFLVDSYERFKYDFDELIESLFGDLSPRIALSMFAAEQRMIERKIKVLEDSMWKVEILSGIAATCGKPPIRSFDVDKTIAIAEGTFFFRQLGLDDDSLRRRTRMMSIDEGFLKKIVTDEFPNGVDAKYCEKVINESIFDCNIVMRAVIWFLLQFVGSFISQPIFVPITKKMLTRMLQEMKEIALYISLLNKVLNKVPIRNVDKHVTQNVKEHVTQNVKEHVTQNEDKHSGKETKKH